MFCNRMKKILLQNYFLHEKKLFYSLEKIRFEIVVVWKSPLYQDF